MALLDQMYCDQKYSLLDTFRAFGRTLKVYLITGSRRLADVITAQKRRGVAIETQKRRADIITGE
jgi:hypothetical protein